MKRYLLFLVFCSCLLVSTIADAQVDRVRTVNGSKSGEVVDWSRDEIQLETNSGLQKYPTCLVEGVIFANEPTELTQARINLDNGGYLNAKELLAKVKLRPKANKFLQEDFAFMKAECLGRLAIAGRADAKLAGRELVNYQKTYPEGFHRYQIAETTGDLLVVLKRSNQAISQYQLLSKASWPGYQAKALLLSGMALQEDGKHDKALELLDRVSKVQGEPIPDSQVSLQQQQFRARLARAKSLVATGKKAESISELQKIILSIDREAEDRSDRLAEAYNTLGHCFEESGKLTDAMLSYLKVDYLYADNKQAHAEALYHLSSLWDRYGEPRTAQLAKSQLKGSYGTTRWARELANEDN